MLLYYTVFLFCDKYYYTALDFISVLIIKNFYLLALMIIRSDLLVYAICLDLILIVPLRNSYLACFINSLVV